MKETRYIVFFDLDNTILKINSGEVLLRKAYKNGLLSTRKLIHTYFLAILHKLKILDPYIIIEKFGSWLAKLHVNEMEILCTEIVEKDLIPVIRPEIISEIKRHKEAGADIVMLSTAISSICFPIANYLELNSVICSELEVENLQYTGKPIGKFCFKEEKLNRLNQYIQNNNQAIENCWYYADSIHDLPVLQSVGFPVCVKPDKRLEKIARENNWAIQTCI